MQRQTHEQPKYIMPPAGGCYAGGGIKCIITDSNKKNNKCVSTVMGGQQLQERHHQVLSISPAQPVANIQ